VEDLLLLDLAVGVNLEVLFGVLFSVGVIGFIDLDTMDLDADAVADTDAPEFTAGGEEEAETERGPGAEDTDETVK
jgi:hypothetical protein